MSARDRRLAAGAFLAVLVVATQPEAAEFSVRAADGVELKGDADTGSGPVRPRLAVIFVPGTGIYDRDTELGESGTPRDLIFKDLAARMVARGVATVRYDMRGVRHGAPLVLDRTLLAGRTTSNIRDDLAAIYRWSRASDGFGASCIAFFAHSEGMLHVVRLAALGAPAPALIIGMGAGMESPVDVVRWQMTERDAYSLSRADTDRDGTTTNEEVKANIAHTPSGVHGVVEPYFHPSGAWKAEDIAALRAIQLAFYEKLKSEVLAHTDDAPYPDGAKATSSYEWWKSWFVDDEPSARLLTRWPTPIILHYGDKDSQTPAHLQIAAAKVYLPPERLKFHVHPDRGHTLGSSVILGPIDEAIADGIADEAAAAAAACTSG
jgi:hypothetical protein